MNQAILRSGIGKNMFPGKESGVEPVSITCKDYYLLSNKGFNYYAVDLKSNELDKVNKMIRACEEVEKDSWNAQEDFIQYACKSDFLVYAEKDGSIVGFTLVTLFRSGGLCIYSLDEAMVLRKYQGKNIARNLGFLGVRIFILKYSQRERVKKVFPLSISANPRVVNNYLKNRYITSVFDNSFNPSPELTSIFDKFLRKNNYSLVDNNYPFCVENLFPGSNRFDRTDKRYQFSSSVRKRLPDDFDHMVRGDAFAFMVRISMKAWWFISFMMMMLIFGKEHWFNKSVGVFSSAKHVNSQNETREKVFVEKRFTDRRVVGIGAYMDDRVNRRVAGRRGTDYVPGSLELLNRKKKTAENRMVMVLGDHSLSY